MTTQLLTVSPAVVRADPREKPPADITPRKHRGNHELRPRRSRPPPSRRHHEQGDWRYEAGHQTSGLAVLLCALLSAGMHVYALFGFNDRAPEVGASDLSTEFEITLMQMPPIEELDEPEEIFEDGIEADELDEASYVPMQADVPSFSTDAVFEQKLDLHSLLPRPDFDSAKVVSIPPRVSRTRMDPTKMKDLFNLADLDRAPVPLLQTSPKFPPHLKNEVHFAEVVVDFIVDKKGKVAWAKVTSASHRGFEDAAILGVSRWQFKPGTKNGKAVNTRMRVPLHFRVTD